MDRANLELILVAAMMVFLFLFGVAAVLLFWRTWRREQKAKQAGTENPDDEPLEFLRVDYQVAVEGKDPVYFARATWPQGSQSTG